MKRIAFAAATVLVLGAAPLWADDRPYGRDADDTGRNARDRDDTSGTKPNAMDQSNDPADVKLTADIRKSITDDDSLSMNAHNVKVITRGGNVVLRGPVDSAEERDKVAAKAKQIAGVKRVDNQLEINKE
jgi:osmotically-inducible protein OsmY